MSKIDYQEGKIYLIKCHKDPSLVYVGSTANTLNTRWSGHKQDIKRKPETLLYKKMAENPDEWYIELYERFPCESFQELKARENEIIALLGTLNTYNPAKKQEKIKERNKKNAERYKNWISNPENQEKRKIWREQYNKNPEKIKMRYVKELNEGQLDYARMKQTTKDKYDIKYDEEKKIYY